MFQGGENALQAICVEFDSLAIHQATFVKWLGSLADNEKTVVRFHHVAP